MLSIQTNVNSMNAQENLRMTNLFQGRTIARLTSGYRINDSGDDAAGLAIANKYRSDVAELVQGVRNGNDGLSTLQIIDGGLNNISKMLDRLKTLATQSASATFTGDRGTLNKEYQDLLSEVDRQAGMVGLASSGSKETRNNMDIGVYMGGSQQGTAKVTIELSGNANRVDKAGLNLTGTTVADGGATVLGTTDLRAGGLLNNASGTQSFTFDIGKDNGAISTINVTVTGNAAGISADDALTQLNSGLTSYGITASLSSDGYLQFSGNVAFKATANANTGTALATSGLAKNSTSAYRADGQATWVTDADTLTFKIGTVTFTSSSAGANAAAAATAINAVANQHGIYAFTNDAGTGVVFQSTKAFTVSTDDADNVGVFDSTTTASYTAAPLVSSSATSNAETAIAAIQKAVSSLGSVQGKVGTAQNKISYAIQLAQSQITSFSAAESRIRDADVAEEAANLTKAQVLQQASLAALAQANSAPQAVLSLLRG